MMTVTSRKYHKPTFVDGMVCLSPRSGREPLYVKSVKYVWYGEDMAFIYDGVNLSVEPTYSTTRKHLTQGIERTVQELLTLAVPNR
jgi:hypothetical protein